MQLISLTVGNENAVKKVMNLADDRGVDVAIEAVGVAETFELCQEIVNTGGHIANVGWISEK